DELRASEAKFRRLFDSNIIGLLIADTDGHAREANDAFLRLIGYTREELAAGRVRWETVTPPEYHARTAAAVEEMRRGGTVGPWEKEYVRKDGGRVPVLVGGSLLDAGAGLCLLCVVDLTAQKR